MRIHYMSVGLALICSATMAACGEHGHGPTGPDGVLMQAAKGGNGPSTSGGGGAVLVAEVVPHTEGFASIDPQLASTCPGSVAQSYAVVFGHTGCLIVQPTGSAYALTDDIVIGTVFKRGQIQQMNLTGQDVIGDAGIQHETDWWTDGLPVTPNDAGFIVHVHKDQVPVYRLSGHRKGSRVEMIGTVAIGDIVYRPGE